MSTLSRIRRLPLVAFAIALAALLAACGGPEIPLNGTIVDAYTGKPVPAATINLGGAQLSTDAGGKYQVTQWSEKDTLQIAANGYEPISIVLAQQPQLAKPTPPAMTLDAKLRPNTITGAITDAYSGRPLAGALVKASAALSATTAADGRYTLVGVPESFTLTISAPEHEPVSQSLKQSVAFDIALRPNTLAGVVTDRYSNQPVAGATVKVGDTLSANTGADGKYRLTGVPANATVQFNADGYAGLTQPLEKMITLDAVLRPDVLKGTLVD